MRTIINAGFFWRFAGGFALGVVALVLLQPADATRTLEANLATAVHFSR
jgi:hypothetical protein